MRPAWAEDASAAGGREDRYVFDDNDLEPDRLPWLDPIIEVARRHGLKVIEDNAQAQGAHYRGRTTGTLGDAAATPILSSFKYFRSEFEDLVTGRTPPVVDHRQLAGAH